jgi:phosphate-selective porin OprO/OprP
MTSFHFRAPRSRRACPSLALALASILGASSATVVAAEGEPAQTPTLEELARRLQALEAREGATAADGAPLTAADLDQRLRVLERKLELQEEAAAAKAASTPSVTLAPDKGLAVKSPDGDSEIKLRGLVQADGRFFLGDDAPANDGFLWRRIRPTLEGNIGPLLGFRLTPEFAGDSTTIVDAYVDLKFDPRATVRIGKIKGPVGLERLQTGGALAMVERGFPTELVPNRDLGVQLQGALADARLNYVVGVYNGTPDGRDSPTTNPDDEFEFAGRLFFEPWRNGGGALSGLGFGIAGSVGDKNGSGNDFLPRYRTPGQATFFNYRDDVLADGEHRRWSPQAYWYRSAFGLLGEYVSSTQELSLPDGTRASPDNRAWQMTASYVLTGEDASYRGVVKPNRPFASGAGGWGAFEVVARYGRLEIDDAAFPLFADPAEAASSARAWGLGLNWYLTTNLKLVANYTRTRFDSGAEDGNREDEQALFTRAQFSF